MAKCGGEADQGILFCAIPRPTKRLSLDLKLPDSILARRGGISFGSSSKIQSRPRLGVSILCEVVV